jgi:hypothetical protein
MRVHTALAAIIFFLLIPSSASAFYLTQTDYDYLATLTFQKRDIISQNLSPKEEFNMHGAINDVRTENDRAERAKIVFEMMTDFITRRGWERSHPGKSWDTRSTSTWPHAC